MFRNVASRSASSSSNPIGVNTNREEGTITTVVLNKAVDSIIQTANNVRNISPVRSRESSMSSRNRSCIKTFHPALMPNVTNDQGLTEQHNQTMDISSDSEHGMFRIPKPPGTADTAGKHKRDDDSGTDGSSVSQSRESRPRTRRNQTKAARPLELESQE